MALKREKIQKFKFWKKHSRNQNEKIHIFPPFSTHFANEFFKVEKCPFARGGEGGLKAAASLTESDLSDN